MSSIASSRPLILALALVFTIAAPATSAAAQEPDRRIVRQLAFEGNRAVSDLTLANVIETTNSSWFARVIPFRWLGLGEKREFFEQDFRADVLRLHVLYKQVGYPDVQIDTIVRRTPENVYITFRIREGTPILVTSFNVVGLDSLPPWLSRLAIRDLPLEQGDVFNRFEVRANVDSITYRLRDRGYPNAQVLQDSFVVNNIAHTAYVRLRAVPGTRAVVGSVDVIGAERVEPELVRRLIVAQPGRRYSAGEIFESQRNLYRSELFRYATVEVDTTVFRPGHDTVPLRVQVSENDSRGIRGSLGYATNDCFRSSLGWTKRNFLGGGRILDLSGRLSKIGAVEPLDWGLAEGICNRVAEDTIGSSSLNFSIAASVRRPAFLSPYNSIAVSLYTERRSEFKVYLRRETGVRVAVIREAARRRIPLSLAYTLSYGRTEATAANFCAFFNACTPDVLGPLQQNRVLATLTGTAAIPRLNNPVDPSCCSTKSLEVTYSSKFIGSSTLQQFVRVVADAAWYRPLTRTTVLSWRIRGGVIFAPRLDVATQSGAFIPPEHRFYAGGPNDVRGFERNELGPVVYVVPKEHVDAVGADSISAGEVRVAATGGNTLAVGNMELRFPSPILSSRFRLAAFVDAGTLWQRTDSAPPPFFRVTPGVGMRVNTPLGPARLDVAYNPYDLQRGALFQADNNTGALTPVPGLPTYRLEREGKFTLHFAVGQPF